MAEKKTQKPKENEKGKEVKSQSEKAKASATNTSASPLVLDFESFMTPISILLAGIMVSSAIIFGFNSIEGNLGSSSSSLNCSESDPLSDDCLTQYAVELGAKADKFETCMADGKYTELVTAELDAGTGYKVGGTPTMYIGKGDDTVDAFQISAGITIDQFSELVDKLDNESVEATANFWKETQLKDLEAFKIEVETYYSSAQGGSLTGEALATQTNQVLDQRRAEIEANATVKSMTVGDGVVEGKGDIALMVFSDYECPYCKQLAAGVLASIRSEYVDSNQIRNIFRDFPLESIHPRARASAESARCAAEQVEYFDYHDKLFGIYQD